MEVIYFQPKGINPKYCEAGMIHESDPDHIWYLGEPCKELLSGVKIIPKEKVFHNEKTGNIEVIKQQKKWKEQKANGSKLAFGGNEQVRFIT